MTKVPTIEVEYIADERVLRLIAPPDGIEDHARLEVEIKQTRSQPEQPWMRLAGSLSTEDGQAVARAIRDAFGRDEIEV